MAIVRSRLPAIASITRILYGNVRNTARQQLTDHKFGADKMIKKFRTLVNPAQVCKSKSYHRSHGNNFNQEAPILHRGALTSVLVWLGFRKPGDEEEPDPLLITVKQAVVSFEMGDYNLAELQLHAALKMAQDMGNQLAQLTIFDLLANNALVQEQFSKARDLFTYVLRMMVTLKEVDPSRDEQALELSAKIAVCYSKLNQFSEADEGFRFVTSSLEKMIKEQDLYAIKPSELNYEQQNLIILYAMILEWKAKHLAHKKDLSSAVGMYRRAIDIATAYLPDGHPQLGILYNDLSTVYSKLGNHKLALSSLETALKYTLAEYERQYGSLDPVNAALPSYWGEMDLFRAYQAASYDLAVMHFNIAYLLEQAERWAPALEHVNNCVKYTKIAHDEHLMGEAEKVIQRLTGKINN